MGVLSMYMKTERLVLQPISESDYPALMELLRDEQIKKTYMLPDFESDEKCLALARRLGDLSRDESRCVAGIYLNGELIGFANDVEMTESTVELGYVIAPAHWGRGYATEALKALIVFLHGKGFREVVTGAFEENAASIRVMVKAGMALMDKRDEIEYRGKLHQCVYYVAK